MINLKLIETNFDEFNEKLKAKNVGDNVLSELLNAYNSAKSAKLELEELQSIQNSKSKELGIKAKNGEDINALKDELNENKSKIATKSEQVSKLENALETLACSVPNLIDNCVPLGKDENENVEIKRVLSPREFDFSPLEHFELGSKLGWLDFERGAKLSGSRFSTLRGMGARLNRALINYMIDFKIGRAHV